MTSSSSDLPNPTAGPATRPPLDAARLAAADPDVVPGVRIEVVDAVGSTNAVVADRARAGEAEGLVVVAEHQTAGRGRLDRTWETPARSGLTLSLLLRPQAPAADWPWLPLLAGYEVHKTLRGLGYDSSVKWPNDVLLGDRKVCGVLSEVVETTDGAAVVVGIGLNVGMEADELPVPEATSLLVAAAGTGAGSGGPAVPDRTDLLVTLLGTLWEGYLAWQAGGASGTGRLAESYAEACATVGRRVRVDRPSAAPLEGTATGVDPHGRLVVVPADGSGEQVVGAGDVQHVRST